MVCGGGVCGYGGVLVLVIGPLARRVAGGPRRPRRTSQQGDNAAGDHIATYMYYINVYERLLWVGGWPGQVRGPLCNGHHVPRYYWRQPLACRTHETTDLRYCYYIYIIIFPPRHRLASALVRGLPALVFLLAIRRASKPSISLLWSLPRLPSASSGRCPYYRLPSASSGRCPRARCTRARFSL